MISARKGIPLYSVFSVALSEYDRFFNKAQSAALIPLGCDVEACVQTGDEALRSTVTMYPEIAIREIVANMLVHQDFSEKGFPTVEIYTDRIDISNPGQPIISVERFIDEYNSRNSSLADLMRRLGICEELGSGLDKAVAAIELFQLPPLRFTVQEARTTVTLFAYRKYADLDRQERIYACYQHACLKYVANEKMTNLTLRERLGIEKQNYPMASRIIRDAINAGKIKEEKTENQSRNNRGYIPFWAQCM